MPSPSQREAIEHAAGPVLVLAGPGAGKTFCLIERIRFLIERLDVDPARICAFTFTNKAADEIASRLARQLGPRAEQVKRGTLHAFCAELLREHGSHVGLAPGFGIADDEYQRSVLRRLQVRAEWLASTLARFTAHRFCEARLRNNDAKAFDAYLRFLADRNLVDFDMLVLKTAELLTSVPAAAESVRRRWDQVLVDEFQDLNPKQYAVIHALTCGHRNVFAVGDDEQSIYSWAGADPRVFLTFLNDFEVGRAVDLQDNRRCPRDVFALARRLVMFNPPIFVDRIHPGADRDSGFPVAVLSFTSNEEEIAWIIDDVRRDREAHGLEWGEFALLYRRHEIGAAIETSLLGAGVPCRMAQGRALADDPAVGYVIAALRVIANPSDTIHQESFFEVVLPGPLFGNARAKAEEHGRSVLEELEQMARELPRAHGDGRKIRRGFSALRNLAALGQQHATLSSLVEDILSQRVGQYRTILEERHDELTDPAAHPEVVRLTERLLAALMSQRPVWIPRLGGVEIALKGMLYGVGFRHIVLGGPVPTKAEQIRPADLPLLGIALGVFKAVQLIGARPFTNAFRDFTTVDLETTDKDVVTSEIVEIAAVRVRDGKIVDEFHALVRPRVPIDARASKTHGYHDDDVAGAPYFEEVWPRFREFCAGDVLVAHNGYQFDFPILRRMAQALPGGVELCTYDTLPLARELRPGSCRLADLARVYGVDAGRSHRALDDTRALAHIFLALGDAKLARARKTTLVTLLDYLGIALALSDEASLGIEAQLLRGLTRAYALGRYSDCLEVYRFEYDEARVDSLATVDALIERLGGEELMRRIRVQKTAEQRYPAAMMRLRRLLDQAPEAPLGTQIATFLERAVLSRWDGVDPEQGRVNLLTLHSTKGLEFSRVYVVGVEDSQLPGKTATREPSKTEVEESRRLLYVGMTRARDRLVLTRVETRGGKGTGGHRFLDEMELVPREMS